MFARIATLGLVITLCASGAQAQRFNIDFNDPYAPPSLGGGPPSSLFGAAAGQAGYWNAIPMSWSWAWDLQDLTGAYTNVDVAVAISDSISGQSAYNPLTTGDYALLLNDARQVGYTDPGGYQIYTFTGLENGPYQVYTYAAPPSGGISATPVVVPGSTSANPQVVTGPIPADSFALGITHSLHDVLVTDGTLVVNITMPPGVEGGGWVAGMQIVPEPAALVLLALGGLLIARRGR
jgi:hypothetical protein